MLMNGMRFKCYNLLCLCECCLNMFLLLFVVLFVCVCVDFIVWVGKFKVFRCVGWV